MSAPDEQRFDENCEMAEAPERCATCGCVGHIQTVCPLCERECSRNTPAEKERCAVSMRKGAMHEGPCVWEPAEKERCRCGPHDEVGRCEESAALARRLDAAEKALKRLELLLRGAEKDTDDGHSQRMFARAHEIAAAALTEIRGKA